VPGIFGNIFDVLVASETHKEAIDSYRAVIVAGQIHWTPPWAKKLEEYVRNGGVVVLNTANSNGLPPEFLGVQEVGALIEEDAARCLVPNEPAEDLRGQKFRYRKVFPKGAELLIATPQGDPLVTVNRIGRGKVVFVTVPDLLGEDERLVPFAAHVLAHLAADATPVKIEGDVEYLINRNSRGWVITIFNDNGVLKPQQGLAQVDRRASVEVKLSLRGFQIASANEWTSNQSLETQGQGTAGRGVTVTIPPGGVAVVELVTAR
jgi:hypothetical protein